MKCLTLYWRFIIAVLVPILVASIFLLNHSQATKWLYVVLIMIIYWATEALPNPVTSLLPIALFPLLGLGSTVEICKLYAHETVITFLGSLIIASSVEMCNLHKRIALKLLCHVKCGHRRLHFVLMAMTMFISMWMLNFSVVAMMCPVCVAILEQFEVEGGTRLFKPKTTEDENEVRHPTRITMSYLLGITYAATLGGCGSLLGTPTNLALKGIFATYFPEADAPEIDFLNFFLYCAPIMLLNTLLTWLWLQILFMGLLRPKSEDAVALVVTEEGAAAVKENIILNYKAMGAVTAAEIQVAILLVVFQCVLVFRSRWEVWSESVIKDASPTIIFVIILFMVPSQWNCCRKTSDENHQSSSHALLTWTFVRRKIPWGLVFFLGAGIVIADSGKRLEMIKDWNFGISIDIPTFYGILLIVCLGCQVLTEFITNVAAANIILPLLAELCVKLEMNPLHLMLPAALSISMAFHSSIGTPGNALVAILINIPMKVMIYCGIGPSIITLLTYWSTFPTYGVIFYGKLNTFPEWATNNTNNTGNATAT